VYSHQSLQSTSYLMQVIFYNPIESAQPSDLTNSESVLSQPSI
jgi:hypothetical protein